MFPISCPNKEEWNKKVLATYMYSIPAEDDALPILRELLEILVRLHSLSLQDTLQGEAVQYFFSSVFVPVCQKIIKSRYFKSDVVLGVANQILQLSVCLIPKYLAVVEQMPAFLQVLTSVLNSDEFYFKTNNQLHEQYLHISYFSSTQRPALLLSIGDYLDILKLSNSSGKCTWSQGRVVSIMDSRYQVEYLYDLAGSIVEVQNDSYEIAPWKTKSKLFEWRMNLKEGDLIDCEDSFGGWYNATILKIKDKGEGRKSAKISFKVYDQKGTKLDQNGRYFGFAQYEQSIDVTSPKIQPFCSILKSKSGESGKSALDGDDINDPQFTEVDGERIYAFPRKKLLSETLFKIINEFGRQGGFEKILKRLEETINFGLLSLFVKGISGVAGYLHRELVRQMVERLKPIIDQHIFSQNEAILKEFTKQRSQMLFSGFKTLQKRICTMQAAYQYQNLKKMKLVQKCLQSQTLKRKLQGLNQLKDIVRSLTYSSGRNTLIKNWIKEEQIFSKIYITNSHVQLIKKSQDLFRYLINESILQITDLRQLYKIAQKGDYESRISIFKLFQEVSHIFKKPHVDFLIDSILQSDLNLVLNEDIDLLHEMSRFSNYFPREKVIRFFENIILGDNQIKHLSEYATKKYSQIVSKGFEMRPYRRQIIHSFLVRLPSQNIIPVSKVLKGIFEGIGLGQYGKKQLNDILAEQNIDEVAISAIRSARGKSEWATIVAEVMSLLLFIYKLSYRVKIHVLTLKNIWLQLKDNEAKRHEFCKWLNEVIQCEQGVQESAKEGEFQELYAELFPQNCYQNMNMMQFQLAKSLFLQINKKARLLIVSSVIRDKQVQRQYRRKVEMKQLRLGELLMLMIYNPVDDSVAEEAIRFFQQLYNAKQNLLQGTNNLLKWMLPYLVSNNTAHVYRTLQLIHILIDDSEKRIEPMIPSLLSRHPEARVRFIIINDITYLGDSWKKAEIVVGLNQSVGMLRKHLAMKFNLQREQIRIVSKSEIPDYYNSRTLREICLNASDVLTISRKPLPTIPDPELIQGNHLVPKAVRCLKMIFSRYTNEQGLMNRQRCHEFTGVCIGSITKRYDDKVTGLFQKYDCDNDGLLTAEDFLKFYEDAARDKASTVWANLKSFGVNSNFQFPDQASEQVDPSQLPRHLLSLNLDFYKLLFSLLHNPKLPFLSLSLLLRLPIPQIILQQLGMKTDSEGHEEINVEISKVIKWQDSYSFYYRLMIIKVLLTEERSKNWRRQFLDKGGIQALYLIQKELFSKFIEGKQPQVIELEILNSNFELISMDLSLCFMNPSKFAAVQLLERDYDLDDKIQFLILGVFPKVDQKLGQMPTFDRQVWKGESKSQILTLFVKVLKEVWIRWGSSLDKQPPKNTMLHNLMNIITLLLIDEDPSPFIQALPELLSSSPSQKLTRQLYTLILVVTFYSSHSQHLYITDLFQHITLTNITSEYFRMLSVLVAKFGMEEESVQGMPEILWRYIVQEKNEMTVEGCAKLLVNFHIAGKIGIKEVDQLWDNCLFGESISCKKQSTRHALYDLLLKICQTSPDLTSHLIELTMKSISPFLSQMKINYSTQLNQRSIATEHAGLKNLGNICYINSMMQQLYNNKIFRFLIMRIDDKKEKIMVPDGKGKLCDDNLLHQVQRIFGYLQKTTRIDYIPLPFCIAYKPFGESINVMIQQDVQEFVSMFFDRLQQTIKSHPLKHVIDSFYTGKATNLFNCHDCKQTKQVQENFFSLSLEVKNFKTLAESFNRFNLGELISDYKCDFCGKKSDVSKKTRISKAPQVLIIHLQRIVFNLDTFINEKISTKHEFPTQFNLFPFTLQSYLQENAPSHQNVSNPHPEFQYELSGIICHNGNAEMGHYISYIKNQNGKWFEFNDSLVSIFNPANIETQCFGGSFNFDDDYDWEKRQNSKSAYLLIYQKVLKSNVEIVLQHLTDKESLLKELNLQEDAPPITEMKEQNPTQSQQEQSSEMHDSEKQKQEQMKLQMEQIEMIRKHKSEDNIDVQPKQLLKNEMTEKPSQTLIKIKDNITPYMSIELFTEIQQDNKVHFFEKCMASVAFSKFFANLLILPHSHSQEMIRLCQKLTFGFWLKSASFKELLSSLTHYISEYPQGFTQIIAKNESLASLLIQNTEVDVRSNIAIFLANSLSLYIEKKEISLNPDDESEGNVIVLSFLDHLFSLLPTTVSRCWTKFSQYFQFWYQFSKKGQTHIKYMARKQIIKHFLDYFLDKKSPLKIYINKPQIGSHYASPNFTMLLRTVESLLQKYLKNTIQLSKDEQTILLNYDFIDKLISDNYENIACKVVSLVCPNNLYASERIAVVLCRGFNKSNYQTIQPYLDVFQECILIQDDHKLLRIKWLLGKPCLHLTVMSKSLYAMNGHSFDDRLYHMESTLGVDHSVALLEKMFADRIKTENLCMLALQAVLKVCLVSKTVKDYIWQLPPMNLTQAKYVSFFDDFITKYIDDAKRMYYSSGFNKEDLGKNVRKLYDELKLKISEEKGQNTETSKLESNSQAIVEEQKVDKKVEESAANQSYLPKFAKTSEQHQNQFQLIKAPEQEYRQNSPRFGNNNSSDNEEDDGQDYDDDNFGVQYPQIHENLISRNQSNDSNAEAIPLQRKQAEELYEEEESITKLIPKQDVINSFENSPISKIGDKKSSRHAEKGQLAYSSDQEENLLKSETKKPTAEHSKQKVEEHEHSDEQHEDDAYHPVKFNYKQVAELQSGVLQFKIIEHQSQLISVRTQPIGHTNKTFAPGYSGKKIIDRLPASAWKHQKISTVHGFRVQNGSKASYRLQTDEGSVFVKAGQTMWIWSDCILKVFFCQKSMDWPKWSLYAKDNEVQEEQQYEYQDENDMSDE